MNGSPASQLAGGLMSGAFAKRTVLNNRRNIFKVTSRSFLTAKPRKALPKPKPTR